MGTPLSFNSIFLFTFHQSLIDPPIINHGGHSDIRPGEAHHSRLQEYPFYRWQAEICPPLDENLSYLMPEDQENIQRVTSFEMMAPWVAAGYGVGVSAIAHQACPWMGDHHATARRCPPMKSGRICNDLVRKLNHLRSGWSAERCKLPGRAARDAPYGRSHHPGHKLKYRGYAPSNTTAPSTSRRTLCRTSSGMGRRATVSGTSTWRW